MRVLKFINRLSPGDILCMSAAIHSLHRAHPGRYMTGVDTPCPQLWEHNPDIASEQQMLDAGGFEEVQCHYPLFQHCNQRPVHVLDGYVQ